MNRLLSVAGRRLGTGEEGFTLVELSVAMAVMLVIAAATISLFVRGMTDTAIVTDRSAQQNDGRLALERMSKDIRQATALSTSDKTATSLTMTTYQNGVSKTISWRLNPTASGSCAIDTCLEYSVNGATYITAGTNIKNYATSPTTDLFQYVNHDNVTDEVIISLKVGTKPSATIPFSTTILLRNLDYSTL